MTATTKKAAQQQGSKASRLRQLSRRGARGSAFTEYMVTVAFFGIVVGAAVASRTKMVLVDYANSRDLLFLPGM